MPARRAAARAIFAVALVLGGCGGHEQSRSPASTETQTAAQPAQPPPSTRAAPSTTTLPPPARPFSWESAGAFVWHTTDVDPTVLGQALRGNGFGWVAVALFDGATLDAIDPSWLTRFRQASGLPIGGWGVLRDRPEREAALASTLVSRYDLDFYIADAEADYELTGPEGKSSQRFGRSRRFVSAFRRLRPFLPAGLSSFCRPDRNDLDWQAWQAGGFGFLPQAYVNDFGAAATPSSCVQGADGFFPKSAVHPTIGVYAGRNGTVGVAHYGSLLAEAGTVGFSVYLAETGMTNERWQALGRAITTLGIAH